MVVAEIELAKIAFQVLGTDMLVRAVQATLQDREVVFNGIGMNVATDVFTDTLVLQ